MRAGELEFQRTHDTFRPKIHRYLTRWVGEPEAEDLTQEVFIKVSRAMKDSRGDAQLSTWIYRIATNAAIDKMRAPSFRQATQTSSLNDANETEGKDVCLGEDTPSSDGTDEAQFLLWTFLT